MKAKTCGKFGKSLMALFLALVMVLSLILPSMGTVEAAPKLNKKKVVMSAGTSRTLKVKNAKQSVSWSSSNKKVVTVSKKGVLKARKAGSATVTAKTGGKSLKCKVTVKAKLSQTKLTLAPGSGKKLTVKGATSKVTWSSSNKKVATVNAKGKVQAKSIGSAVIKAKFGKTTLKCKVTVTNQAGSGKISVSFTNSGIVKDGTKQTLETWNTTEKIQGTVTVEGTTLSSLSYSLKNESGKVVSSGSIPANLQWSYDQTLISGVNELTVEAKGADGSRGSAVLYITKYDSEISLNESAVLATTGELADFLTYAEENITVSESEDGETQIHLIVNKKSELYEKLDNGELKIGDTYMIPACDEFPTGLTGVILSYVEPEDTSYDSDTYVQVNLRSATMEEVFSENGNIKLGEIDEEDPIAFAMAGDGTLLTVQDEGSAASYTAKAKDSSKKSDYTRSFFPDITDSNIAISSSVEKGKVSVKVSLKDLIIWDNDKKRDTKDQIKAEGTIELNDIGLDFNMDWDGWNLQKLALTSSYTEKANVELSTDLTGESIDITKAMADDKLSYENKLSIAGWELSGIDMSGRVLIAAIGIRLGNVPSVTLISDLNDYAGNVQITEPTKWQPTIIIGVYLDLEGKVTIEGTASIEYSRYSETTETLVKNSNQYKSEIENSKNYDTVTQLGKYSYYTSKTVRKSKGDKSDPEAKGEAKLELEGNLGVGVGCMAGVMVLGIIPADIYGKASTSLEGTLSGSITGKANKDRKEETDPKYVFETDGKAKVRWQVGLEVAAEVNLKFKVDAGLFNFSDEIGGKWKLYEHNFFDEWFEFPCYELSGTIYDYRGPLIKDYPLEGAQIKLYYKEDLEISDNKEITAAFLASKQPSFKTETDENGAYDLREIPEGTYEVMIQKNGFETQVEEIKLELDKTDQDYYLRSIRAENWLDVCRPYEYTNSNGGEYLGDAWGDTFVLSGITYNVGFWLGSGDNGSITRGSALFNLQGKYSSLHVAIGRIDGSSPSSGELRVYLDGSDEPNQTITLNGMASKMFYDIDLNYAQSARFEIVPTVVEGWCNGKWAFVDGTWEGVDGSLGTVTYPDAFEDVDWNSSNFLDICSPFSGRDLTVYKDGNSSFTMSGITYDTGFTLGTESVVYYSGNFASFFLDGKFSSVSLTIGHVDGKASLNTVLYVYLDGSSEASQEIELSATDVAKTYDIDLGYATCVTFKISNSHDNWSTTAYGFANGVWKR